MVNMQMIDVDKIVEVARKYAGEHRMCEVVEEALLEANVLVKQSGYLTLRIPILDYVEPVAYGRGGDTPTARYVTVYDVTGDVEFFEGEVAPENITWTPDSDLKDKAEAAAAEVEAKAVESRWRLSSARGSVLHYFSDYTANSRYGMYSACGIAVSARDTVGALSSTRHCARCDDRTAVR